MGERVARLDSAYCGLGEMACAGRVDEFAAQVGGYLVAIEHSHATGGGHVGHMGHLKVLLMAIAHEFIHVFGFNHYRHAFLAFADGYFCGVEAGIFCRHTVKIDVEAVGEFSDCHAHASGSEVVGFLYESCHLRTSEQASDLAFFRRISFLHLASAFFERRSGVLFGRACGSADAVSACAASEHKHHVAFRRAFTTHVGSFYGSYHGSYFKALGNIVGMINFAHMCCGQANLVAVGRVSGGCA